MAYDEHDFEKDLKDAVDEAIDDKMWELSEKLDQRERALEKKIEVWGSIAQKFEEKSNNRQYYEMSYNKQALRHDYEILCAKSVLAMLPRREKERRKSKVMITCGIIAALCSIILAFFYFPLLFKNIIETGSVIILPALFGALLFMTFYLVPFRMIRRGYFFVFMITDLLLYFIRSHSYKEMTSDYSLIIVSAVLGGSAVVWGICRFFAFFDVDLLDFDSGWDGYVVNADKNICVDACAREIESEGRVGNDKLSRDNILMLTNQDNLEDIKYYDSYARWRGLIDLGKAKFPFNIFWMIVYVSGVIVCYLYL